MSGPIDKLASLWPTDNPAAPLIAAAGVGAGLTPEIGLIPRTFGQLLALYQVNPQYANYVSLGLFGVTAPVIFANIYKARKDIGRMLRQKKRKRGFWWGGMWVDEDAFWTHILVTGMTGSGKSATAILPAIEQIMNIWNDEDADRRSKNKYKKIGMAVLEVKGTFFEYLVFLAYQAGRHASEDVVVFRPDPRLLAAHFVDERGRHWYMNGMLHTWRDKEQSSDAHQLYAHMPRPNGAGIYPPTMFEPDNENVPLWAEIRKMEVPVPASCMFIGWRWDTDNTLVRVSHTPKRDAPEALLYGGKKKRIEAPKTLRFVDVQHINNGLRTNIVKPNLPAGEVASRLKILTKLAKGGKSEGGGDNDFFYDAAEKQMENIILLHRAVHNKPGDETTAIDIVRMTTDDKLLAKYLQEVELLANRLKLEIEQVADPHVKSDRWHREYMPLVDVIGYFNNQWKKLQQGEGKTAHNVNFTLTNTFAPFTQDPNLRETYCSRATLDYRSIWNDGKILCFVPGRKYETKGKVLAGDFKMDVITTGLNRKALGLEMWRPMCFLQDEAQEYIISHETAGDNKALSLWREFRSFYFAGTQSDAWVDVAIGRAATNVYLQSFGARCWLRNTDQGTNERATKVLGKIKVEDRKVKGNVTVTGLFTGDADAKQDLGFKEKNFIEPDEFGFLDIGDSVVLNVGAKGNKDEKRKRTKLPFAFCTSPEGHAAVGQRLRYYYQEVLENTLHKAGQSSRIDEEKPAPASATPAPSGPVAPAAGTTSAPGSPETTSNTAEAPTAAGSGSSEVPSPAQPASEAAESCTSTADGPKTGRIAIPKLNRSGKGKAAAAPESKAEVVAPSEAATPSTSESPPEGEQKNPPGLTSKLPLTDPSPIAEIRPSVELHVQPAEPTKAKPTAIPAFTKLNVPSADDQPTTPQQVRTPGVTKEDVEAEVEAFSKYRLNLDCYFDELKFKPVMNHKVFIAEMKERFAGEAHAEHALANQLAVGQSGKVLGAKNVAAEAGPKQKILATPDLAELTEIQQRDREKEQAMRRIAEESQRRASEPEPVIEQGTDVSAFASMFTTI